MSQTQMNPLSGLLNNPAIQQLLITELIKLITSLINKANAPKVVVPVEVPTPAPVQPEDDFADDIIPAPAAARTVTRVRLKLARAQYNKQRFPQLYTSANPMGLYSPESLREIEAGQGALNWGSKFWLDLTAYDAAGKEFLRDAVLSHGLAYKTVISCGDATIRGNGADPAGTPLPYTTNDTDQIGNGITAWNSSLGFLHQMKAHGEGTFTCSGQVAGVTANTFSIRVS